MNHSLPGSVKALRGPIHSLIALLALSLLVSMAVSFESAGAREPSISSKAGKKSSVVRVESREEASRFLVRIKNFSYRGPNRTLRGVLRIGDRAWALRKDGPGLMVGRWQTSALKKLRGQRARLTVFQTRGRKVQFKVRVVGEPTDLVEPTQCQPQQLGAPPNCVDPEPEQCDPPLVGTPPNCVDPEPEQCDPPLVGTPPNCVDPEPEGCPDPQVGTPPDCIAPDTPPTVSVGATSEIVPAWSAGETDFTVLCSTPLEMTAESGSPLSLDGQPAEQGVFGTSVSLQPGQATTVTGTGIEQTIRCRPDDMFLPTVSGRGESGLYLVAPSLPFGSLTNNYAMVLNQSGVPIWWAGDPGGLIIDFKQVGEDLLTWTHAGLIGFVTGPNGYYMHDFAGNLTQTVGPVGLTVGADHHDIQRTPDGNWLVMAYLPRNCPDVPSDCVDLSPWGGPASANVIDGVIQKVDNSGGVIWEWSTRDHLSLAESADWIPRVSSGFYIGNSPDPAIDIVHINSVEPDGDGFLLSVRHTDAVYRIEDPAGGGAIDWKLGGTATAESLTVIGDTESGNMFGGQHDARRLADGTITLHDNGTFRNRPPRAVRYEVDADAGTATLLEAISDSRAPGSGCCGSSRRLANGNWLASWGSRSIVTELEPSGAPVFTMTWPGGLSAYRAVAAGPGELDPAALRTGMDTRFPRQP